MTKITDMTSDQLAKSAKHYDGINEGGDGYNPYREEMGRRARAEAAKPRPLSRAENMQATLARLNRLDSSIARESGTYKADEVETLRAHYANLVAEDNAEFLSEWTLDVTQARREANNNWVRANSPGGRTHMPLMHAWLKSQGWTHDQLRRAMDLHGLKRAS